MTNPASTALSLDQQLCYAIYSAGMAIQRAYKPLLDELGITYPQYLVLSVLWRDDALTVGVIAEKLALESSTLTPLLKRLESAELVQRTRNPENERQVVVSLTPKGQAMQTRVGCLGETLLATAGMSPAELGALNSDVKRLRDSIYTAIGGWSVSAV
ncbi:MAG TPA: MarR family transcriptional regulator [Gemmatimonas aurantiaca]|uniref:MarR family transcriptional regulator n=2 Tax=Gemmatimonas aurantiaca TaxID=173480 RepID=C1ADZ0_GEMAT|nr:MarR family transcriptional regulator [Gemmatimonas aurantiaca]BAH40717.1 MarR family transcriptional regulator [Gemmatimonas aurantiaca T-27]HCT59186.1 MarR family transcriptional regulator [Gemmatimonas aurantiaca]